MTRLAVTDPDPEIDDAAPVRRSGLRLALLAVAALVAGFIGRSLVTDGADSVLVRWLPWLHDQAVTLYFGDDAGTALVPVTRHLPRDSGPEALVAEMLAGPAPDTGLVALVPAGTAVQSVALVEGTLTVALSGEPGGFAPALVRASLQHTFSRWKGVDEVAVLVSGVPLDLTEPGEHLIYFYDESRDMVLGRPTTAEQPREVLAEFLAGPGAPGLVGLPSDVELLEFEFTSDSGLLSLDFTYQPSVREFALDHPEAMRRVLEGLIATMTTGFPQIEGLYLDFEGRATLGLGQCADLLRTLQLHPEVLNDERLLARRAS